ncbi:MAG TPA: hypothetical protein VK554_03360 [Bradyrhizobium sp.]|nr:hypothetical protein [Bradyrhizobium sp.]
MTKPVAIPEPRQPVLARPSDSFARLTPLGWTGGLVFIVALLAASFILAGYFVVYWRTADMDFMVVYSALLLNDGQPAFFPHPAYFTVLGVKLWFQVLHHLNLLDTSSLSRMPPATDRLAFDAAMTSVIRAARVVAWMTATSFVVVFAGLARCLVRDWRVATLATFAFAFSGGVEFHTRVLRSEMIAGCLIIFALMILIAVSRRPTIWRPLAIGAAATLCVLGLENKIHAILPIAALPLLILPFGGPASASNEFWSNSARAWLAALTMALVAGLLLRAALPLIALGLDPTTAMPSLHPLLLGKFGVYQLGLLAWIGAGMLTFAMVRRVCLAETFAAIFAVIAGASLGLLALFIEYNPSNVVVVLNPIEEMMTFADQSAASAIDSGNPLAAIGLFLSGVASVLQRYTFVLFTSPRPTVFLTWLIVPGIAYAWRRGERQTATQSALLMLCAIAIDSLGIRRGLKVEYFIFTDPLIIIAGMVLLDQMNDLRFHKLAYPIGAALVALHIGVSQAEPIKMVTARRGPERICEWSQYYLPLLPMPWCELPAKRP